MTGAVRWTRHSLVLSIAGAIYVLIGVAFFIAPPEAIKAPSLKVALQFLSINTWGWVFVCVGALVILSSFSRLGRKTWGYMLLTAISSAWAAFYAMAIVFYRAPITTVISALTWALLAVVWWGISGLISPEHTVAMMVRHHEYEPD